MDTNHFLGEVSQVQHAIAKISCYTLDFFACINTSDCLYPYYSPERHTAEDRVRFITAIKKIKLLDCICSGCTFECSTDESTCLFANLSNIFEWMDLINIQF